MILLTRPSGSPVKDFRRVWANACKKAGCPGRLFHDLRRTAARNLRRAGVAEGTIMAIGGWKTRSVFDRYNITDQRDIARAMFRLEEVEKAQAVEMAQAEQKNATVTELGHDSVTATSQEKLPTVN